MLFKIIKILSLSFILLLVSASNAFAFESVRFAISEICGHMQGNLGGLLMTTAGIGGIVAATFGNLRASHSLIVVGVGAAALSAILSLYFPAAAEICDGGTPTVANGFNNDLDNTTAAAGAGQTRTNNFGAAVDIASGRQTNFANGFTIEVADTENDIGF